MLLWMMLLLAGEGEAGGGSSSPPVRFAPTLGAAITFRDQRTSPVQFDPTITP